ncbi:hypothetical protein [Streptomyces sp. NPDC058664]|uniref:hypothetical protein n=1 Tax=unclassified Streptomyces TaxID=2593676 RepID=UPI0036472F64
MATGEHGSTPPGAAPPRPGEKVRERPGTAVAAHTAAQGARRIDKATATVPHGGAHRDTPAGKSPPIDETPCCDTAAFARPSARPARSRLARHGPYS